MIRHISNALGTLKKKFRPGLREDTLFRYPNISIRERVGLQLLAHKLLARSGGEIFHGPLSGLKIVHDSF